MRQAETRLVPWNITKIHAAYGMSAGSPNRRAFMRYVIIPNSLPAFHRQLRCRPRG